MFPLPGWLLKLTVMFEPESATPDRVMFPPKLVRVAVTTSSADVVPGNKVSGASCTDRVYVDGGCTTTAKLLFLVPSELVVVRVTLYWLGGRVFGTVTVKVPRLPVPGCVVTLTVMPLSPTPVSVIAPEKLVRVMSRKSGSDVPPAGMLSGAFRTDCVMAGVATATTAKDVVTGWRSGAVAVTFTMCVVPRTIELGMLTVSVVCEPGEGVSLGVMVIPRSDTAVMVTGAEWLTRLIRRTLVPEVPGMMLSGPLTGVSVNVPGA